MIYNFKENVIGRLFIPEYYKSMLHYSYANNANYAELNFYSMFDSSGHVAGGLTYFLDKTIENDADIFVTMRTPTINVNIPVTPSEFSASIRNAIDHSRRARNNGNTRIKAIFLAISRIALQRDYPQDLADCFGVPVFSPAGNIVINLQPGNNYLPACHIVRDDAQNSIQSFASCGPPSGGRFWGNIR
ncbi:hypothetical protein [Xenorhabdus bharatensis]|uniref:hypothetical protein n=1 Tax=Xenorhabdus bharatensis TaxID=3136256 RepID=UPI0030F3D86D